MADLSISDTMRFAYADPPYLGQGVKHYGDLHAEAGDCDDPLWHKALIERLCDEFPDGWALSLHTPSLKTMLNFCPDDVPIGYAWEATCDHPGCEKQIDRGLAYACGGMHGNEALGGDPNAGAREARATLNGEKKDG